MHACIYSCLYSESADAAAASQQPDSSARHSKCSTAMEIHTAEAILKLNLLFGPESTQLISSVLKREEVSQLQVLSGIIIGWLFWGDLFQH
jgi:hypothetical protein